MEGPRDILMPHNWGGSQRNGDRSIFERNKSEVVGSDVEHRNEILPSKFIRIMCVIVAIIMVSISLAVWVQQISMEQDSKASIAAPPPVPRPDLYVSWMQITDAFGVAATWDYGLIFGAGQDFTVNFEVSNKGTATAVPFSVDLYIDQSDGTIKFCGRVDCSSNLPVDGIFGSRWMRVYTSIVGPNPVGVRVVADSTNTNIERYENNNQKTLLNFISNAGRTVAIYMCADNNIESYAIQDFVAEMAATGAGSSRDLSIVVMMDRSVGYDASYGDWTDAKYFFVKPGGTCYPSDALQDVGEVNMGDPNTLHNFATWAFDRFRSEFQVLILWDHGGPVDGVCYDNDPVSNGDNIKMNELDTVLQDINTHIGKKLNVVGFDACFQGWLENYYVVRQWANAVVGAAESEAADGWPYDTILGHLKMSPSMATSTLCSYIVQDFHTEWQYGDSFHTMSAFSDTGVSSVATSVSALAQVLWQKVSDPSIKLTIQNARSLMKEFPFNGRTTNWAVDVYEMALILKSSVSDQDIKNAAQNVINTINTAGVVFDWACGSSYDSVNMRLCALLWPTALANIDGTIDFATYRTSKFSVDTSWDEFLAAYYDTPPTPRITSISPNPAFQGQSITFSGDGYDSDGTIVAWEWSSSINGVVGTSQVFSTSTLSPGIHDIVLTATDDKGVEGYAYGELEVKINNPPVANIVSILPNPAGVGVVVSFDGSSSDDGSVVAWRWFDGAGNGAEPPIILSTSEDFSTSSLAVGTHQITFRVQDNLGAWSNDATRTLIITAPDPPPTAPGKPTYTAGDERDGVFTLTWTAASDTDSTPVARYELIESKDGGAWATLSDQITTTSFLITYRTPATYLYMVRAIDTANNIGPWSLSSGPCIVPRDLRLTTNSGDSMKPSIAVDSAGNYHVIWQDASDGNNEIYYMKLDPNWNIITPMTRLTTNSYNSIDPDIAVSGTGVIKVIWRDNRDGNYEIYTKTYNPSTSSWGADTRLTKTTANDKEPDVDVDSSGNFYFVWHDSIVSNKGLTEKIWFSVNGNTPSSIYTATGPKPGSYYDKISEPRLACGATGVIHLVFALGPEYPYETGTESIKYMQRSSSTWGSVVTLKSSTGYTTSTWVSIDADSSGNVYVSWMQIVSLSPLLRQIGFIRSSNGGTSWNLDTVIPGTEGGWYPEVSCLSNGRVYLGFYNDPNLGMVFCAKSSDYGIQWSVQAISPSDINMWNYNICADPNTGRVGIVWDGTGAPNNYNFEIYFTAKML